MILETPYPIQSSNAKFVQWEILVSPLNFILVSGYFCVKSTFHFEFPILQLLLKLKTMKCEMKFLAQKYVNLKNIEEKIWRFYFLPHPNPTTQFFNLAD